MANPRRVLQVCARMGLKGLGNAAVLDQLEPHVLANAASY